MIITLLNYTKMLRPTRLLVQKRLRLDEPAILAHALGLLSPKAKPPYKPSLFRHLQKGSVTENYSELKQEFAQEYQLPQHDHSKSVNNLLLDLEAATSMHSRPLKPHKSLSEYVKTISDEEELLDLLRLSFYQQRLSLSLLTRFMLNRSLQNLHLLPFDVDNLETHTFALNGWTRQNVVELKIIMMKKYHDLHKPLSITKILRQSFDAEFLPLIEQKKLSPFYERIVWKFYFEYAKQLSPEKDEAYFVEKLRCVRLLLIMWESSTEANLRILKASLATLTDLLPLQKAFLQLCACESVQKSITAQLANGSLKLLSSLKKISIKYKIYSVENPALSQNVVSRAHAYSLIHALEDLVEHEFGKDPKPDIAEIMAFLASQRSDMVESGGIQADLALA